MDGLSSSCSSVLLLGEGNFSFARSLSHRLPRGVRVTATSFESEAAVCCRKRGKENVDALTERGVTCLFEIDATAVHTCPSLQGQTFDGILFNFPHVAGKANIAKNRDLLRRFFQSCVHKMSATGQVLVTLCNGQGGTPADKPQREEQNSWQVVAMATYGDLILTRTVPFRAGAYTEYDSTGYRGQDKGFLTQQAVTHVFQKCEPVQLLERKEVTLSSDVEGKRTCFRCPSDLSQFMERKLLLESNHPLNRLNALLVSGIQSAFPHSEVLQPGSVEDIITGTQTSGCGGVYRLHESGCASPDCHFTLRPQLLCHMDALAHEYATKGCVLAGRTYHRCRLSTASFPVMHQLLLCLPRSEVDVAKAVAKMLNNILGDASRVEIKSPSENKDGKEDRCVAAETKGANLLKRKHSETEDADTANHPSVNCSDSYTPCQSCMAGKIEIEGSLYLANTSGDWTTVGVLGHAVRNGGQHDIALLFLDQLIMRLLHIHDVRLLWSSDVDDAWEELGEAFSTSGREGRGWPSREVQPRSLHPPSYVRDVSFWVPTADDFDELRFTSVLRRASGTLLRRVWRKGIYRDPERGDQSLCYRLEYASCDRALSKATVAGIHRRVLELIHEEMQLKAR